MPPPPNIRPPPPATAPRPSGPPSGSPGVATGPPPTGPPIGGPPIGGPPVGGAPFGRPMSPGASRPPPPSGPLPQQAPPSRTPSFNGVPVSSPTAAGPPVSRGPPKTLPPPPPVMSGNASEVASLAGSQRFTVERPMVPASVPGPAPPPPSSGFPSSSHAPRGLEAVPDECPFTHREHKVQVLYEIAHGMNFVELLRIRGEAASRGPVYQQMTAVARRCVHAMLIDTFGQGTFDLPDVWCQFRPGQMQSVLLDTNGPTTTLLDAAWPLRIYVAIRCAAEDAAEIAGALQDYAEDEEAFADLVALYQQVVGRIVEATVDIVEMDAPATLLGVRDGRLKGQQRVTTITPLGSARNTPLRQGTPRTTRATDSPLRRVDDGRFGSPKRSALGDEYFLKVSEVRR